MLQHPLVRLIQLTIDKYNRDSVGSLAAAIAYFSIFSVFPLLLVVTSLVGFVIDPARYDVQAQLLGLIGSPEISELVGQTLETFSTNRVNAGLIGIGTLLFAATGIFAALTRAMREIWELRPPSNGDIKAAVVAMVMERAIAFGLLLMSAGLILVVVLGNFAITLIGTFTDWLPLNNLLLHAAQVGLTLLVLIVAFAVLYKVLPDRVPAWGDVWPGAIVAAFAFYGLQALAEQIFGRVNFSAFGVLGGAMTFLLWIFISAQILLVGVEVSYAWAHVFGSRRDTEARG